MPARHMSGLMAFRMDQFQFDLDRRITKQPGQLRFGFDLGRHQIQEHHMQWTDILRKRPLFCHHKDVFLIERLCCRKILRNLDGHVSTPPAPGQYHPADPGYPLSRRRNVQDPVRYRPPSVPRHSSDGGSCWPG